MNIESKQGNFNIVKQNTVVNLINIKQKYVKSL